MSRLAPALRSRGLNSADTDTLPALPPDIACLALHPPSDSCISGVMSIELPPLDASVAVDTNESDVIDKWFSTTPPTAPVSPAELLQLPIPINALDALRLSWREFERNGARSIIYAPPTKPTMLYPLWILTWWIVVASQKNNIKLWTDASQWLAAHLANGSIHPAVAAILAEAQAVLSRIPWNVSLPFEAAYATSDLTFFLSDHWLASRHIDWMLEDLQRRVTASGLATGPREVIIYAASYMENLARKFGQQQPTHQERISWNKKLEKKIEAGVEPRVYLVGNYQQVHWLAIEIDFKDRMIRYGDSMGGQSSSARFRNVLKRWLQAVWGYTDFGVEELPCCKQNDDGNSCGICAVNTIEARIFGDRIWEFELAPAYRAFRFLQLARNVLLSIGELPPAVNPTTIDIELAKLDKGKAVDESDLSALEDPNMDLKPLNIQEDIKKGIGYTHTQMNASGIDLGLAATFPTDYELSTLTRCAYNEAQQLARTLGMVNEVVDQGPAWTTEADPELDSESDVESTQESSTRDNIQDLVEQAHVEDADQALPHLANHIVVHRDNLVYATAAVFAEQAVMIDEMRLENDEDLRHDRELLTQYRHQTRRGHDMYSTGDSKIHVLPDIHPDSPQNRNSHEVDSSILIRTRHAHGNPRALKNSKNFARWWKENQLLAHAKPQDTAAHNDSGPTPELPGPEHGLISHTALARAFAETLRTHEENKVSNRLNRWKDGNTVGNFAGNVANAKKVADAQATKYVKHRLNFLQRHGVTEMTDDISTGRVSTLRCISADCVFAWTIVDGLLTLARVLAVYVRGGGQYGMHLWVPETSSLGHVSHLALQTYQKTAGSQSRFRATHFGESYAYEMSRYRIISANDLLVILPKGGAVETKEGEFIHLSDKVDITEVNKLSMILPHFSQAMKAMEKASRKRTLEEGKDQ